MKNSLLFLFVLFVFFHFPPAFSQPDDWSDSVPVTDSISNNTNAIIRYLNFIEYDHYMFWEKSMDSSSTSIYYKKFYDSDEMEILQSGTGIHYKNPQLVDAYYNYNIDTNFIIFYEEDTKGYNDISYQVYTSNGFTDPVSLTTSSHPKTKLMTSYFGDIVWLEQNKVMYMNYDRYNYEFSEPKALDSGNCSYPSVIQSDAMWGWGGPSNVAWIKHESDSAHIRQKEQNYQGEWQDTETIFIGKECLNLSFCGGFGFENILSWDHFNDTAWHIEIYHPYYDEMMNLDFTQEEPFYPFVFSGDLPVKKNYFEGIAFLNFISNHEEQTDVLTSYLFWVSPDIEDYENVSNTENQVRNAKIFMGKDEPGCKQYFINIWEENVNDNWQLKFSEMWTCLSAVEETKKYDRILKVYPNPMKDQTEISFVIEKSEEVKLVVRDFAGNQIEILESQELPANTYVYRWDGSGYPNGVYFVSLQTNSKKISKKIILIK